MQLSGAGLGEIIVAKYSSVGEFIWATSAASTGDDRGVGVAVDSISNVFITGYYGSQIQFGCGERNDTIIVNSGSSDLFIAKFSPSGEFIWVTTAGGNKWEQGKDIQVDRAGNSYVTGFYRSNLTFGSGEPFETDLFVEGSNDIFVAKFKRSFNTAPEFELMGNTNFLEDFIETRTITVNQVNTPDDEMNQLVSYSISPESSDLFNLSFDGSSGALNITSSEDKFGEELFVITADNGEKENYSFSEELLIAIEPVNDAPMVVEYIGETTLMEGRSVEILLTDLNVNDIDNEFPNDFSLSVQEGENYQVTGNLVSPKKDFIGSIFVPIKVNDRELDSEEFLISFEITELLGIDNEFIKNDFKIYPNPTSGFLNIIPNDLGEYQLTIFTPHGESINFPTVSYNSNSPIDLSGLPDGLYLLKIHQDDRFGVIKLIIKND